MQSKIKQQDDDLYFQKSEYESQIKVLNEEIKTLKAKIGPNV